MLGAIKWVIIKQYKKNCTLDEVKASLCVSLDLFKAFGTMSHRLLLQSLEDINIRNKNNDNYLKIILVAGRNWSEVSRLKRKARYCFGDLFYDVKILLLLNAQCLAVFLCLIL